MQFLMKVKIIFAKNTLDSRGKKIRNCSYLYFVIELFQKVKSLI